MSILNRLTVLLRSNLNDVIGRAEDPEKILNQLMLDMQQQMVEAKKQVAVALADEKRLRKQMDDEAALGAEWEKKAVLAVRQSEDDLAKQALVRRTEHHGRAREFAAQWEQQHAAVEKLKEALRGLGNKVEEAKRKKTLLIARKKRAEAQRTIQDTMSSLSDTNAFDTFGRMTEKVDRMEAEAAAHAELGAEVTGDTLADRFKQLEASSADSSADDLLAELKAKMELGAAPAARALPAASGSAATVEAERETSRSR